MRGLVLAMVLAPIVIDERPVPARVGRGPAPARVDPDSLLTIPEHDRVVMERYFRQLQLRRAEPVPIPLWYAPVPWAFIPPRGESPRPTPTRGTALSLGIVRATFERPSTDSRLRGSDLLRAAGAPSGHRGAPALPPRSPSR